MALKALEDFSFLNILEAAIDAKGVSEWHQESDDNPDRPHRWHASALGGCPRAQIFKRAGLATDGITLKSKLTFELGHFVHSLLETGAPVYHDLEPDFELVASEVGYYHPTMPLASKCDAIVRWRGELVLLELKTEHELAAKRRAEEASKAGRSHNARPEHVLQATATAMCAEHEVGPISQGRIMYISKSNMWTDQIPVELDEPNTRAEVRYRVETLETMWKDYRAAGTLPGRMPKEDSWLCAPRSPRDPKGKWCGSRTVCFSSRD